MGVDLYGLHFHCGSGQHGSSAFKQAIEISKKLMRVGKECGHRMRLLDLGGGFPASDLSEAQVEVLESTRDQGYRVVAEPGRHFSQETCWLAVRVIGKREKMEKICYHVNDGFFFVIFSLYHSFNLILMDGVSFENQTD
jgi:diaminopimelate decarboxylase